MTFICAGLESFRGRMWTHYISLNKPWRRKAMGNEFVYTTYIRTTPEKVWDAITKPEFARQYWANGNISDWKQGSEWKHVDEKTGKVRIVGKVLESTPPKRLVTSWASPANLSDQSQ